jgi:hypothetical protein
MRNLTDQEISRVSGGMLPTGISTFSLNHRMEPNQSSTFTANIGPLGTHHFNTGTHLSCAALGAGAAPIGGTIAALGAAAASGNPAVGLRAYQVGGALTGAAVTAGCHFVENQQFRH